MVDIYAVIGANYGDEGKGLVTNYLCKNAFSNNKKVLNVLTNGGCQRGHTAYIENKIRHVYSHFGSGYPYADIYFSKFYKVNPMVFFDEYNILKDKLYEMNKIYIDNMCTITTPYDMLVNRLIENRRTNKHGSCGYGIWETVVRNTIRPIYWKNLIGLNLFEIIHSIRILRDTYFINRLKEYNIKLTVEESELFYSETLLHAYCNDIINMQSLTIPIDFETIKPLYDTIIFENAQGLLLDYDINPWGTPSKTGMTYIRQIVKNELVIPYYVTRSYLTKHGNGDFPGECNKNDINPNINDITNHPNNYQGTLRYGKFNETLAKDLLTRIKNDCNSDNYKIVVTHTNEFSSEFLNFAHYYSDNEFTFNPI